MSLAGHRSPVLLISARAAAFCHVQGHSEHGPAMFGNHFGGSNGQIQLQCSMTKVSKVENSRRMWPLGWLPSKIHQVHKAYERAGKRGLRRKDLGAEALVPEGGEESYGVADPLGPDSREGTTHSAGMQGSQQSPCPGFSFLLLHPISSSASALGEQ